MSKNMLKINKKQAILGHSLGLVNQKKSQTELVKGFICLFIYYFVQLGAEKHNAVWSCGAQLTIVLELGVCPPVCN